MRLLDVAVGPVYVIFGLGVLILAVVIFLLFYFAIRLIIKIKRDNDTNDS